IPFIDMSKPVPPPEYYPPPGQQPGQYAPPGQQPGQYPPPGQQPGQYSLPGQQPGQYPPPGQQSGQYPPPGQQGGGYPSANYGPPPQGNYGQYQPSLDPQHVVLSSQPQPMTNTVVVQSPMVRPSSYLILAIFTTICCNPIFGIVAIIFSVMSSSSADNGDLEEAVNIPAVLVSLAEMQVVASTKK
ncbi:unnamed protein product, partial [Owenia fusiformis]